MLHRLSRKSLDQGLVGLGPGTGLRARQSIGLWGAGSPADLQSAAILGRKEGHLGNKFQEKNMNYQADQIRQRNEMLEANILKQVDKSFVLCIDPETKLPFMVNMGLKMADVCDLDNRPLMMKHMETAHQMAEPDSSSDKISYSSASEAGAAVNKTLKSTKNSAIGSQYAVQRLKTKSPLLNPKNYPFYQNIKRNLYTMEQLLTD